MSHASIRMIVHVVNGTWRAMDRFATREQRRDFVVPSIKGELKIAFTLTEPTAGTGADLRCSVVREGDTYYLSGEKHLITFGTICDYWLLFARLAGTRGADGTVALLVDRHAPGATVTEMDESMGVRGTDHGRLAFDRTPVPVDESTRRRRARARDRARRISDAEPNLGCDELRRSRAARAGAGDRVRRASVRRSASGSSSARRFAS